MTLAVAAVVLPTLFVTVRRGLPSEDALLGISFRTMATVLSAALASFPYNSEINNDLCQDRIFRYSKYYCSYGGAKVYMVTDVIHSKMKHYKPHMNTTIRGLSKYFLTLI